MRPSGLFAFATCASLALLFLVLAATRRLNFDEALALRAGWLEIGEADAAPAFVMPATLALGALARAIGDPGTVFLVARLVVAATVLLLLGLALHGAGLRGARWATGGALALAQGAFVSHGLEFRYDAAILGGLLALAWALGDRAALRPAAAGVAVALIGLHHLKGLALAPPLALWALIRLGARERARGRFAAGAGATLLVWVALLAAGGLLERWLATLRQFWSLAGGVTRVPIATALGPAMAADLAWWVVALLGLGASAWAIRSREARADGEGAALVLGGAALAFVLVHPHPWPYMLALPAPFLAALAAARWPSPAGASRRFGIWCAVAGLALAVQFATTSESPVAAWRRGFAAPRAPEVESLRRLRAEARPDESVLDPSGIAYFLPPCTREWYTDTLFAERAERGEWMAELARGLPRECVWALDTYRLAALPPRARAELGSGFTRLAGGLAVRRDRAIPDRLRKPVAGLPGRVENYW